MPAYRIYRVDGVGKFWAAEWVEAEDDKCAIDKARELDPGPQLEVWQGPRLVARLAPRPNPVASSH